MVLVSSLVKICAGCGRRRHDAVRIDDGRWLCRRCLSAERKR